MRTQAFLEDRNVWKTKNIYILYQINATGCFLVRYGFSQNKLCSREAVKKGPTLHFLNDITCCVDKLPYEARINKKNENPVVTFE